MVNPHAITREFERAVGEYTGAPFVVSTNSCTMALLLACRWHLRDLPYATIDGGGDSPRDLRPPVEIPRRTYVSVPQSIIHAGGRVAWRDEDWSGAYQLRPYPIWDSARWFKAGLYPALAEETPDPFVCVSFHISKTLGDSQGGAILHSDPAADAWLRRARFDGRREGVAPADDDFDMLGYHCYLSPDVAARLLWKLLVLPRNNSPLSNDDYPDLSRFEVFQ